MQTAVIESEDGVEWRTAAIDGVRKWKRRRKMNPVDRDGHLLSPRIQSRRQRRS
uniref:Uncharacterized protein n=1 Tax=Cucumis melo TaxID=3656 RepID=A0A9I9CD61_CUCME